MIVRAILLAAALAAAPLALNPDPAAGGPLALLTARAQLMSNDPWNYSRGSRGFWANYQAVKKSQQSAGDATATGAGGGGSGQEVIYYYSSSTAIANQTVINQEVGDGATAVIDGHITQDSNGNQTADVQTNSSVGPTTVNDYGSYHHGHPGGSAPPAQ